VAATIDIFALRAYALNYGGARGWQRAIAGMNVFCCDTRMGDDGMTAKADNAGPPAYFVAEVEIHDPAGFQPYAEGFPATLAPFGGRLVSFGAPIVPMEGMEGSTARAAIVVFPNIRAAEEWFASPTYRQIAPLRHKSARTRAFYVAGLATVTD
jgi:uncharacterized protein (DUF1330 family)